MASKLAVATVLAGILWMAPLGHAARADGELPALRAELLTAPAVMPERIAAAQGQGTNAVVVEISGATDADKARLRRAATLIVESGLRLYYWIEVGRNEELARAHPEWMASLQGHAEWRRFHPDFPQPAGGQVVKNFPWVPIHYRESFAVHLDRVRALLADLPAAEGIFLNDLQGGPSACGCGNTLCRWTADYGSIRTATDYGDRAAADFVEAVEQMTPESKIIPVWVTECEQSDGAHDGPCAGVGCYDGICWRAYCRQLTPLARTADQLGVLLTVRAMERDTAQYEQPAGWITHALATFQTMPPRRGGTPVAADRLIAVIQGWDVPEAFLAAQKLRVRAAGAAGYVVASFPVEQSWQPRIIAVHGR